MQQKLWTLQSGTRSEDRCFYSGEPTLDTDVTYSHVGESSQTLCQVLSE